MAFNLHVTGPAWIKAACAILLATTTVSACNASVLANYPEDDSKKILYSKRNTYSWVIVIVVLIFFLI